MLVTRAAVLAALTRRGGDRSTVSKVTLRQSRARSSAASHSSAAMRAGVKAGSESRRATVGMRRLPSIRIVGDLRGRNRDDDVVTGAGAVRAPRPEATVSTVWAGRCRHCRQRRCLVRARCAIPPRPPSATGTTRTSKPGALAAATLGLGRRTRGRLRCTAEEPQRWRRSRRPRSGQRLRCGVGVDDGAPLRSLPDPGRSDPRLAAGELGGESVAPTPLSGFPG
jgi:hypothetical protein